MDVDIAVDAQEKLCASRRSHFLVFFEKVPLVLKESCVGDPHTEQHLKSFISMESKTIYFLSLVWSVSANWFSGIRLLKKHDVLNYV